MKKQDSLPTTGFLRLKQILGDKKADPPIPAIIPVSRGSWFAGIKCQIYPAPIRLTKRTSLYRVEDIRALIDEIGGDDDL